MAVNGMKVEGAKAMSEMLKVNTTLTELDLSCEKEERKEKRKEKR